MTVHPGYHLFVMLRVLRRKQTKQVSKHCLTCIAIVDTLYITQCTSKHAYDDVTKNEIDYIMTDEPSMVTDVTVVNRINVGRTADQCAYYQISTSNINIVARTRNIICVHKNHERYIHGQLNKSITAQKTMRVRKSGSREIDGSFLE